MKTRSPKNKKVDYPKYLSLLGSKINSIKSVEMHHHGDSPCIRNHLRILTHDCLDHMSQVENGANPVVIGTLPDLIVNFIISPEMIRSCACFQNINLDDPQVIADVYHTAGRLSGRLWGLNDNK